MERTVYMMVSRPPLRLPMAFADTVPELAKMTGYRAKYIHSQIYKNNRTGVESKFIKVSFEDDE